MQAIPGSLFVGLLAIILPTAGFSSVVSDKVDDAIGKDEPFVAVFVRMDDQLFNAVGDYERFCEQQPASTARRELRKRVMITLQEKAGRSFSKVRGTVERLTEDGQLRNLQRYWIVNGFACEATGKAARALAQLDSVGFVYRQRFAAQHVTPVDERFKDVDAHRALYRGLLATRKDDANLPFDGSKCEVPWNLKRIGADRVWSGDFGENAKESTGYTGRGVVVAVLDSGMMSIPALTSALWKNEDETLNGQDDDGNGFVDDVFGYDFHRNLPYSVGRFRPAHGTLCAGIIAGRPDGYQRERPIVTGIAPRARIMPLVGNGQLRAYEYALTNGADVLSMSYTWDSRRLGHYRGLIRTAHEHLSAAGVVSVGGAGNYARSRPEGWQIGTPKDIPCVIAAAGVTEDGKIAEASSRGPVSWAGVRYFDAGAKTLPLDKPDVTGCFGGYPMWTHVKVWEGAKRKRLKVVHTEENGYVLATGPRGNSFSGPHAAGVAALMLEAKPELPVWHLKRLMESTCEDIGAPGRDTTFGAGMLRADRAVAACHE